MTGQLDVPGKSPEADAMKTTKNKPPEAKTSRTRARARHPVKCPDFYKELKAIYGNKTFDHLLARYDEAVS